MPTHISFSTKFPDRMGDKAGKPTYFPEKILKGTYEGTTYWVGECYNCRWVGLTYHAVGGEAISDTGDFTDAECPKCYAALYDSDYDFGYYGNADIHPKTTTIRKNYPYWKSKEGQLVQPFIWDGDPYRSKHVLFCPPVRLREVSVIKIRHNKKIRRDSGLLINKTHVWIDGGNSSCIWKNELIVNCAFTIEKLSQSEGFDTPKDFFMWFNEDFDGALLKFGE